MKRFSKIMLSVAAVSAVSAAMAVSSMAMTATYKSGSVTLSGVPSTGTSQTLLIVGPDGTTEAKDVTVTSDNASTVVKQIDQKDDSTTFETSATQVAIPVGTLTNGTYQVRIGGTDCPTIQTCEFTVGGTTPKTEPITIGDVDILKGVGSSDATAILSKLSGQSTPMNAKVGTTRKDKDGNNVTIGDVDILKGVGSSDATAILSKLSGQSTPMNAKVGTTVEVVVE